MIPIRHGKHFHLQDQFPVRLWENYVSPEEFDSEIWQIVITDALQDVKLYTACRQSKFMSFLQDVSLT